MQTVEVRTVNRKGENRTFRRAGVKFGPEWEAHELTVDQLKAVKAEAALEVREAKPAGQSSGKPEGKKKEKKK
jgi:hypothetical protein